MLEEWKSLNGIVECGDYYEVSNLGRIKRIKGIYCNSERILKRKTDNHGYITVILSKDSKTITYKVHRLVMLAFKYIDNNDSFVINHIDGDKSNNNIENLEWCTHSYNVKHAYDNKLKTPLKGCENPRSRKIVMKDYSTNELIETFSNCYEASRILNIKISKIRGNIYNKRKVKTKIKEGKYVYFEFVEVK